MRLIHLTTALASLAPLVANAQVAESVAWPIAAGSRVKVEAPALGKKAQKGTVVATPGDTLVFTPATGNAAVSIGTPNISKLEVARGTHTRKARGAGFGFLIGAGIGAIVGAAAHQECTGFCIFPSSRAFDATLVGGLLGAVGAGVGALVGARAVDTWVPVTVPGR